MKIEGGAPYLRQLLLHRPLLGLLDRNLQALRLAGTFWIGGRITNGTVRGRVHLSTMSTKLLWHYYRTCSVRKTVR